MRKLLFLLAPMVFLLPLLLLAFVSPALLGTFAQAFTQPEQGGLGNAYGATSYTSTNSASSVEAPMNPAVGPGGPGQAKMYGGSGPGGSCLGTSGMGNNMLQMDFGWSANHLNSNWLAYSVYRLCNDHYVWETVTKLPVAKALQGLQWPPDLIAPQYANQVVTLEPLSTFDPNTQQVQQQQQQYNQQNQPNGPCDWVPNLGFIHPHIDICEPVRMLVNAGSTAIRSIYQNTNAQISFMWKTPLQPFQDDKSSGLLTIWSLSWGIVLLCVTAVIAYSGLRYMLGSAVNWLAYANLTELLSRLAFGLLAAYVSKDFFLMLIQANNALTGIFNHTSLDTVINGKALGVVDESLQIVYGLMGFCLIIEEVARIAILYLLFAFAPILFFLASLRETQRWAKTAAVAAIVFVFIQAVQAATLDVGGRVLGTVLHNTDGQLGFLNLLISLAILYITLMLFFSLARVALNGGITPFAAGAFGLSRGLLPTAAGYVGGAAAAYRRARSNLFRLPGPDGRNPGNTSGGTSGGPISPTNSGGSGGQTAVTVGAAPFVNRGNKAAPAGSGSPGGPAGSSGNPSATPASSGNNPGSAGTGSAKTIHPANSPSVSKSKSAGSSSTANKGQWQKAPPAQNSLSNFTITNQQNRANTKNRGKQP